jgi:hypothetical protein
MLQRRIQNVMVSFKYSVPIYNVTGRSFVTENLVSGTHPQSAKPSKNLEKKHHGVALSLLPLTVVVDTEADTARNHRWSTDRPRALFEQAQII